MPLKGNDDYWKLNTHGKLSKDEVFERIAELGYCRRRFVNKTKAQLAVTLNRPERGLMCYDKCSNDELREFIVQRGMKHFRVDKNGDRTDHPRDNLIRMLERQDERSSFPNFLDLPAELRKRIHDLYITILPSFLREPERSPLPRTCRQLEKEVLPVFYGCEDKEFGLRIEQNVFDRARFCEETGTQQFLVGLHGDDAKRIKKVGVRISRTSKRSGELPAEFMSLSITFSEPDGRFILHSKYSAYLSRRWDESTRNTLENRVRESLEALEMNGGKQELTMQFLRGLRGLIEGAGPW